MDKVLVGVPGPWASDYSESADHFTSKIGGVPDCPIPFDNSEPGLLECGSCGSSLSLVSQVYAPVNTAGIKIEERTLYLFGCVKPECGDTHLSWRALRLQELYDGNAHVAGAVAQDPKPNASSTPTSLWDDGDGDDLSLEELSKAFKDLATSTSHSSEETAKAQHKTIKTSVKENLQPRVISYNAPVLPCFYVYIQEEPLVKEIKSKHIHPDDDQINIIDQDTETWDKEDYEYDKALSADRTYLKYKKVIDRCPDQCFRYQYGGKPLLATKTSHTPSVCQLCGAPRHYEMQLMPPLVYFLHEGADEHHKDSMDNWDWMTLIVYTCSKNCSSIPKKNSNASHLWTVAVEEIELQLEEKLSIHSPLIPADSSLSD